MTTQPQYLMYLEQAKRSEMAERLQSQGFTVSTELRRGDVVFDLAATKDGRTAVYEFKSEQPKFNTAELKRLQDTARAFGYEFHVVVVRPPRRVQVEILNLPEQLQDYMINTRFPEELDQLSTHTTIDGVSDVEVSDIHVGPGKIKISGSGNVEVGLQYGGDSDEPLISGDSFPFTFDAVLSADGHLSSVPELSIDTSSFQD